ncbi:hypothetical protein [Formosa algae]|uniref:Uncharacterized protein n=1 Tax=Formosa algae TaxID=225843 RepID=A0A9X0YIS0_9FLAO|nr:hypothetical protein [Formosa algae]MBP1839231.1 hypothetical protein [Formosa algae]MDQ0334008.1 hypothetical protein [Formosa algae]OEI79336.1 hypothetical protein AST99_14055 [Formosa algae]PNW27624.1 hypothetical protein BKP44_12545 [Formosa algae]
MKVAVFQSYTNGLYTFMFENGEDMIFDEIHPRALKQFDLKHDESYIDQTFKITFVEVSASDDDVIYRIDSLKLVS